MSIKLDDQPRVVTVPEDLRAALDADSTASRAFGALSYSNQRRHVLLIEGAKTPETRARRIAKVVAELSG